MKRTITLLILVTIGLAVTYPIVDTGQETCFGNTSEISPPSPGSAFYGQDAQEIGNEPSYTVSGDGLTVYDNVTGLTWVRTGDIDGDGDTDVNDKLSWSEIQSYPDVLNATNFGGYDDWRVPTIKELYSLINFSGQDISGYTGSMSSVIPFIDDDVFDFSYGDTLNGERAIDSQFGSQTVYNETTIPGVPKLFGVNFADGRIKGYDTSIMGGDKTFTLICVRGNPDYGINDFSDSGDGTIIDSATGLMWQKGHSETFMDWEDALAYAEDLNLGGHDDWRLPNAKELQSIIDYTRSPGSTGSAAIDPIFDCDPITNEAGDTDYPWFWTSTTHKTVYGGNAAAYLAFGRASGWMMRPGTSYYSYLDVHGAGAQRSDPKTDSRDLPEYYLGVDDGGNPVYGHGPQGDIIRGVNYVRCVRNTDMLNLEDQGKADIPDGIELHTYPNPFNSAVAITANGAEIISICDLKGRTVWATDGENTIWQPAEDLASGIYIVSATGHSNHQTQRIVYMK